jgi:hypothetical protein
MSEKRCIGVIPWNGGVMDIAYEDGELLSI